MPNKIFMPTHDGVHRTLHIGHEIAVHIRVRTLALSISTGCFSPFVGHFLLSVPANLIHI